MASAGGAQAPIGAMTARTSTLQESSVSRMDPLPDDILGVSNEEEWPQMNVKSNVTKSHT